MNGIWADPDLASYWTNDGGLTRMEVLPEAGVVKVNAAAMWKLLIDAGFVPCTEAEQ